MQRHACGYLAADDLRKGNLAEEGVCQSLENEQHRFCVRVCLDEYRLLVFVLRAIAFDGRIRYEFDDFLQYLFDTFSGQRGTLEYRYDIALQDALGQTLAELLVCGMSPSLAHETPQTKAQFEDLLESYKALLAQSVGHDSHF